MATSEPDKTVYKYEIPIEDHFNLSLPVEAKILCVKTQRGNPHIWALVNLGSQHTEPRKFRLAGTGHPISGDVIFIGSFQMNDETLIFHLFEVL